MSVQALGWVFDHSPAKGTDRLVLLALANHAGGEPIETGPQGEPVPAAWESWPGLALIQREARLDRSRTVNDALARLVEAGALVRIVNGAPDERIRKDRRPNLYRVLLDHGVTCNVSRCRWCGVTRDAPRGDASRPPRGDARRPPRDDAARQPNRHLEPSGEPSPEPGGMFPPPEPPAAPPAEATPAEQGRAVATAVWDARKAAGEPVPGQPFIAVAKIAERLIVAGWDPVRVQNAMLTVPTIATGWVEAELARHGGRKSGPRQQVTASRDGVAGRVEAL